MAIFNSYVSLPEGNGNKYVESSNMSRAYSAAISPIHPLFLDRQHLHRTWLIPSQATFMDGSPLGVSASAQKIAAGRPFMASWVVDRNNMCCTWICLVVYLPLWKIWVTWDDEIPNWMEKNLFQTTKQGFLPAIHGAQHGDLYMWDQYFKDLSEGTNVLMLHFLSIFT